MADKSSYTTMNIRFAKILKAAAKKYLETQEGILGRRQSFNQLINDALIEKLSREGFLPKLESPGEPASDEEEEELPLQLSPDSPDTERPWPTTD